jgi:hypothetical protein
MAFVRVGFGPAFSQGAGFSGEQFHHSGPYGEKRVFAEQIAPLCSRTLPEQSSPDSEPHWSSRLTLPPRKCFREKLLGVLEARYSTVNSSPGNPSPERNPVSTTLV